MATTLSLTLPLLLAIGPTPRMTRIRCAGSVVGIMDGNLNVSNLQVT
jgi:hypothetical protein